MERTKYNFPKIKIVSSKAVPTKNGTRLIIDLSVEWNSKTPTNILINNNNTVKFNKNKTTANRSDIKERNKKFLPLANQLAKTILTKKNMNYTTSQLSGWSSEIRKLSELFNIDYDRIEKALDWYDDHIGDMYTPAIYSAFTLRNKFPALENAMEREKNPYSNGKPKSKFIGGRKYDLCPDGQYRNIHGELYIE